MSSSTSTFNATPSPSPHLPVVAIIGTTGVGKSNLAIELAKHLQLRAEVINADSMQIYRGLDVITNKVTEEETQGVKHRLIGVVDPRGEKGWGMQRWVEVTLDEISQLHKTSSLPLVTGGTTYWVQHLLFPLGKPASSTSLEAEPTTTRTPFNLLPSPSLESFLASLPEPLTTSEDALLRSLPYLPLSPPEELALPLWELLRKVDGKIAQKWHWKDTRKVLRCLEPVWNEANRESTIWEEQEQEAAERAGSGGGGESKRFRTLIFWLHAPPEILNPRLDTRVDKMVDLGMLDELIDMRRIEAEMAESSASSNPKEYASGIFQSIGYKEFSPLPTSSLTLASLAEPAFQDALDKMKTATRQYARSQIKWIQAKLRPAVREQVDLEKEGLFVLDASDLERWNERVLEPAKQVLDAFLADSPLPDPREIGGPNAADLLGLDMEVQRKSNLPSGIRQICALCSTPAEPFFIMLDKIADPQEAIRAHERGKRHAAVARKIKREADAPRLAKLREEAAVRAQMKKRAQDEAGLTEKQQETGEGGATSGATPGQTG